MASCLAGAAAGLLHTGQFGAASYTLGTAVVFSARASARGTSSGGLLAKLRRRTAAAGAE